MAYVTDKEVVYRLICERPGYQVSWYAWMLGGGNILDGEPVGSLVCDFTRFHKVLKVQQRVSELLRDKRVEMRAPRGKTRTTGNGVWPMHVKPEAKQERKIVEKPVVCTETAKRNIAGLRDIVER